MSKWRDFLRTTGTLVLSATPLKMCKMLKPSSRAKEDIGNLKNETHTLEPKSLDFQGGKLQVRAGVGETSSVRYNGEELSVIKMTIDLDFEVVASGNPRVIMTIIP